MSITKILKINQKSDVKRNVIETLYSHSRSNVKILFSLKASDDGYIIYNNSNKYSCINYKNHVTIAENEGKFSKNAVYFPGNKEQKIILEGNIFYNISEFTIATWIKTIESTINPMTLIEIIPKILFEVKNNIQQSVPNKIQSIINDFDGKSTATNDCINVGVYDSNNTYELNIKHKEINNFNKYYWNYIALSFKNDTFYLFINGKLVNIGTMNINLKFNNINEGIYTVVGSSFFDDKSESNEMYIDDLVIYNQALFISDFTVPNTFIYPNFNNSGLKFDTEYILRKTSICKYNYDLTKNVIKTYNLNFDSFYTSRDKNYRSIFKFVF